MLSLILSSGVAPAGMTGGLGAGSKRQGTSFLLFQVSRKFTSFSWLSVVYINQARASCFWLLRQEAPVALSLARERAGSNIAANIAMIAITTNNSISVNPFFRISIPVIAILFLCITLSWMSSQKLAANPCLRPVPVYPWPL